LIKVIVSSRVALETRNALWLLFSGKPQRFAYGDEHYQWRHPRERAVLNQLYELYKKEGVVMPYTMDDFNRDFTQAHLYLLPPEERLKGLPPEDRLKGLSSDVVFKQFSPEERLKGLPPEVVFEQFSPEDRLKGLPTETIFEQFSPEVIEAYLSQLKKNH